MKHLPHLLVALLVTFCSDRVTAQSEPAPKVQVGIATYERKASTAFFYAKTPDTFDVFGQCEITYGAPKWNPAHGKQLATAAPGTRLRLGNNGWTVFDNNLALKAGAVTIPAGIHYLALETAAYGGLQLVVLDAASVRKRKLYATLTDQTKGGLLIPLRAVAAEKAGRELQQHLAITWLRTKPDANSVELVLRYGDLDYRVTLEPVLDGSKAG